MQSILFFKVRGKFPRDFTNYLGLKSIACITGTVFSKNLVVCWSVNAFGLDLVKILSEAIMEKYLYIIFSKKTFIIFLIITLPIFYMDVVHLAGENIQDIVVSDNNPVSIDITETNVPYSLIFSGVDSRFNIQLLDPSGQEVFQKTELLKERGTRNYFFKPQQAGEYQLTVKFIEILNLGNLYGSVHKNDRRILPKFFASISL